MKLRDLLDRFRNLRTFPIDKKYACIEQNVVSRRKKNEFCFVMRELISFEGFPEMEGMDINLPTSSRNCLKFHPILPYYFVVFLRLLACFHPCNVWRNEIEKSNRQYIINTPHRKMKKNPLIIQQQRNECSHMELARLLNVSHSFAMLRERGVFGEHHRAQATAAILPFVEMSFRSGFIFDYKLLLL